MNMFLSGTVLNRFPGFKSLFPFIAISLIGSHTIVLFGDELSFLEALIAPEYYQAMAGSFPIALCLTGYVNFVSGKLDNYWSWLDKPLHRTVAQLGFGVLLTSIFAFLLAFVYFYFRGVNILHTVYLRLDFPMVVLLILLLNTFCALLFFYRKLSSNAVPAIGKAEISPIAESYDQQDTVVIREKETISVQKGANVIPVPIEQICYVILEDEYRYIHTFDGEKYLITSTLDSLEKQLGALQFFRVNRQIIVNIEACTHYAGIEYNKLEVFTTPPLKEKVIVSQPRARAFREWIDR